MIDLLEQEALLSRKQTAKYLGISEITLAMWSHSKSQDLPFIKIGRLCKYRKGDIDDFITRNTVRNEVLQ